MSTILKNLLSALHKILEQFPDNQKSVSFLIATGLSEQGTSTVLKQAQMQQLAIDEEQSLQLFYNKQGIILELNEIWANSSQISLSQLFKKLNRCHRQLKISGLLFFIDIHELLTPMHEEQTQKIKAQTQYFHKFINAIDYPIRCGIMVSKLDQITGFTDFFYWSHELELKEALGFSLPQIKEEAIFSKKFSEVWSNFVSHLNQLMIQKVHTTRAPKKRILIREFPLQLALLESKFLNLLKNFSHPKAQIHGIYFTSSEQKGKNTNCLNQKIQNDFCLLVPVSSLQSVNYKQYFIQGAIQHNQELTSYTPKPKLMLDRNIQFTLGITAVLSIYIVFQTIKTSNTIHQAATMIQKNPQQLSIKPLDTIVNRLEHLPWIFRFLNPLHTLKTEIFDLEKNSYQQQFANHIMNILDQECQQAKLTNSFYALKVYKALAQKRQDQTHFILNWFQQLEKQHSFSYGQKMEFKLLQKFLWKIEWPIHQDTITHTENILNALAPEYLIYELISDKITRNQLEFATPGFNNPTMMIPKCYTKAAFAPTIQILTKELHQFSQDSWVLNRSFDSNIKEKIIELYAKKYVLWWQNLGKTIRPKRFSSYKDGQQILNTLIQSHSIEHLISRLQAETAPDFKHSNDQFNHLVANQFTELHFASDQQHNISQILTDTGKFIAVFNVLNDDGHASFQYLRSYFNQTQFNDALSNLNEFSNHLTQPCQTWIKEIEDEIWILIQQSTKNYLNQLWYQQITSVFEQKIQGKYPFDNSNHEVSIEDFEQFFSPSGLIQSFFREYLLPFVNTTQAQWQVKEMNHKRMPISDAMIQKFIQANIISNMLFANSNSHVNIEFSLEKMSLDPVISNLTLTIGQQEIKDSQEDNIEMSNLKWPALGTKLIINTISGENLKLEEEGYWGFYRLLEQTNVLNDPNDPSSIQVLLEINGNSGRYLLKSHQTINPFLPSIFKNFSLNQHIIE